MSKFPDQIYFALTNKMRKPFHWTTSNIVVFSSFILSRFSKHHTINCNSEPGFYEGKKTKKWPTILRLNMAWQVFAPPPLGYDTDGLRLYKHQPHCSKLTCLGGWMSKNARLPFWEIRESEGCRFESGPRIFESWLSQTHDIKIDTCRFLAWHLSLLG